MAKYIGIKRRRYFASVRENLPTRWKGNSSNPLFKFPDMQRNVFQKTFSGAQFSFKELYINSGEEISVCRSVIARRFAASLTLHIFSSFYFCSNYFAPFNLFKLIKVVDCNNNFGVCIFTRNRVRVLFIYRFNKVRLQLLSYLKMLVCTGKISACQVLAVGYDSGRIFTSRQSFYSGQEIFYASVREITMRG